MNMTLIYVREIGKARPWLEFGTSDSLASYDHIAGQCREAGRELTRQMVRYGASGEWSPLEDLSEADRILARMEDAMLTRPDMARIEACDDLIELGFTVAESWAMIYARVPACDGTPPDAIAEEEAEEERQANGQFGVGA